MRIGLLPNLIMLLMWLNMASLREFGSFISSPTAPYWTIPLIEIASRQPQFRFRWGPSTRRGCAAVANYALVAVLNAGGVDLDISSRAVNWRIIS